MRKILIADDEVFNRMLLEDIINDITEGFEIISVSSGKSALDMIISEKPMFAFLDIILPDISGLDIIQQARLKEAGSTKFILTTGCAPDEVKHKVKGCADAVLYKPFQKKKIEQAFNFLSGSSYN